MSSEIVVTENNQIMQYDERLISTLRNSLYPGAKEESVVMVIDYCKHAKLDIMLKPVHIVPMWIVDKETDKGQMRDVIMPGINLYRIQASRSGCAGISEPEFGEDVTECVGGVDITYPKWCKVTVKRLIKGNIVEFTAKEFWKECYATAGKDKSTGKISIAPNAMWKKRAYGQLAKCAEAQALRKAFPEICAMPTAEEMEGKQINEQEFEELQNQKPVIKKGVDALKAKLGMKNDEEISDINPDTGEVIDEKVVTENESIIDADTIKFLIESSSSKKELSEAMKHFKELKADEKKIVYEIYKAKDAELSAS